MFAVLDLVLTQSIQSSLARYTVRTFSIRRNEKISCWVTVRGEKATEILERGLKVKEFELKKSNFSATGNFGFGIQEVPGIPVANRILLTRSLLPSPRSTLTLVSSTTRPSAFTAWTFTL